MLYYTLGEKCIVEGCSTNRDHRRQTYPVRIASSVHADMIFRGRNGADAYLTGFLRAILKAQDSATRDLAVANFRGELRTRRLNVADIAIIVRPLVN